MSAIHVDDLHRLFDGADRSAYRVAMLGDGWELEQRLRVPEPGAMNFFARRQWRRALEVARGVSLAPERFEARMIPAWWCNNDEDQPTMDWRPTAVLLGDTVADSEVLPDEGFSEPIAWRAELKLCRHRFGQLDDVRRSQRAERVATFGRFCVVVDHLLEVEAIIGSQDVEMGPPPSVLVPPWSLSLLPAAPLSAVEKPIFEALGREYD